VGKTILQDVTIIYGHEDISGETNNLGIDFSSTEQTTTNFRSGGADEYIPGLQTADWSFKGLRDQDAVGTFIFTGRRNKIPVVAGVGLLQTPGAIAYSQQTVFSKYMEGMVVGETHKYELTLKGCRPTSRGVILDYDGNASADLASGGLTLGAVGATQVVRAVLQVTKAPVSGTLAVLVESDGANTYPSPITRCTFATLTGVGEQVVEVAGSTIPNTETDWRTNRVVTGSGWEYRVFISFE
jgi:hypothetical protein